MENKLNKKGALKTAWQTHGKFTKYLSAGGLLLTACFLPTAAVNAVTLNPEAGVLDVAGQFYGTAFNAAANNFIPGWSIILTETFSVFADTIIPGLGRGISAATNTMALSI